MVDDPYDEDWRAYRKLVLKELETLHREIEKLEGVTSRLEAAQQKLTVRVAVIGAGAAAAASWLVNNLTF